MICDDIKWSTSHGCAKVVSAFHHKCWEKLKPTTTRCWSPWLSSWRQSLGCGSSFRCRGPKTFLQVLHPSRWSETCWRYNWITPLQTWKELSTKKSLFQSAKMIAYHLKNDMQCILLLLNWWHELNQGGGGCSKRPNFSPREESFKEIVEANTKSPEKPPVSWETNGFSCHLVNNPQHTSESNLAWRTSVGGAS